MEITKFTLLRRLPRLSHAQFSEHWRRVHGPLAVSFPEFWKYTSRYIQNHPVAEASDLRDFRWDGIAQSDQVPRADLEVGQLSEPAFREAILRDEAEFLDAPSALVLFGRKHVVLDGPQAGAKIIACLTPPADWDVDRFLSHWKHAHAQLIASVPTFWRHVTRYVQYHGMPELSKGVGRDGATHRYAGIGEIWFGDDAAASAALTDPATVALIRPDEAAFTGRGSFRMFFREHELRR